MITLFMKMWRWFCLAGALFQLAYCNEAKDDKIFVKQFRTTVEDCRKVHPLGADALNVLFREPQKEMSEDQMCFVKCLYEKQGILLESGELDVEKLVAMPAVKNKHPPEKLENFQKCLEQVGKLDNCKDMEKMQQCFPELE